jgi:hypothetical protein
MVNDIISYSLFEILAQLIILANLICILNVMLKLFLSLANSGQSMSNFTDNIADKNYTWVMLHLPKIWMRMIMMISGTFLGKTSP